MSLAITGIVLGTKTTSHTTQDGQPFQRYFVGIQTDKQNGYDGEAIVTDLAVSKAQYESGILAYYEKLRGSVATVPVWVSSWSGKNGSHGINMHLGGDGKAVSGEPSKQ
jgi:hypothetical protein